jgi:hypothetical protein
MLLVVAGGSPTTERFDGFNSGEVAVKLGCEETTAPHLTVRDEIDTRIILVAQGDIDRIVQHLLYIRRSKLAPLRRFESA